MGDAPAVHPSMIRTWAVALLIFAILLWKETPQ